MSDLCEDHRELEYLETITELEAENKRLCFRVAALEGARDIARQEQAAAERARDRANAEIVRLEDRLSAAEDALGNPSP